jgi:hypothetical protein
MATTGDDVVEFTIKNNLTPSEAIRRFKRSLQIGDLKVKDNQ